MKIEIGESLVYSFLRHEKRCLIAQTNWKSSTQWDVPENNALQAFDYVNYHSEFQSLFKSNFEQTLRQAEIDVLGIDAENRVYAFDVAFHESGLQYGGKIQTRDRVFKKLLRTYVMLKYYFPNKPHIIAFCSPKVNGATDTYIQNYFEILQRDFQKDDVKFEYYANKKFTSEIVQKVITATINEADSSELFARSIKLLNICSKFELKRQIQPTNRRVARPINDTNQKNRFKQWLIENGKSPNTANSYASGINSISRHYNKLVYEINDLDLLESIRDDCALNGIFSQFGGRGNGSIRNAIARYVEFMRSILNVCNKFELKRQIQPTNRQVDITVNNNQLDINSESIFINNITIPTHPNQNETFQDYIKRLMKLLFYNNLLTEEDILNLKDVEYCRNTFNLQFAMIVDINGDFERKRYWVGTLFNNQFYVCSQWWRDNFPTYQTHIIQWLLYLKTQR